MTPYDHVYRALFSHARMIRDLVTGFVEEPWVAAIDFSTLELCANNYISQDLRERRSDLVWRMRLGTDTWIYLYLMLEFQSTVDATMPLRLLSYSSLMLQELIRQGAATAQNLPLILPWVFYSGERPWTAASSVKAMRRECASSLLEGWQPQLQILVLDEGRCDPTLLETLSHERHNLVAGILHTDLAEAVDQVLQRAAMLGSWLQGEEGQGLRRDLAVWLTMMVQRAELPAELLELALAGGEQTMLAEKAGRWKAELLEQGMMQGLEQGLEQGERRMLQRLLVQKLGEIPADVQQQLEHADSLQLQNILQRVWSAKQWEDLF